MSNNNVVETVAISGHHICFFFPNHAMNRIKSTHEDSDSTWRNDDFRVHSAICGHDAIRQHDATTYVIMRVKIRDFATQTRTTSDCCILSDELIVKLKKRN